MRLSVCILFAVLVCLIVNIEGRKKKKPPKGPKGPARRHKSPKGPCKDKKNYCQAWKKQGYCSNAQYKGYMAKECKKACGLCQNGPVPVGQACVDKDRNCASWASTGECQKNRGFMLASCKKSCGACGNKGAVATYDCAFAIGDGIGTGETRIGDQRGNDCIKACVNWKSRDKTINGVTVYSQTSKKGCWCEKGMRTINKKDKRYRTCFLIPKGQPGVGTTIGVYQWGPWGSCSKRCGGGTRARSGTCSTSKCTGSNKKTGTCNTQKCKAACTDNHKNCASWSSSGYCTSNAQYMSQFCKKSCNLCGTKPVVTGVYQWGRWGSCSKRCGGGTRTRSGTCSTSKCTGSNKKTGTCNTQKCKSVTGVYQWGKWNRCNKRCGGGTRTRTGTCSTSKCVGSNKKTGRCNTKKCKSPTCGKQSLVADLPGISRVVGGNAAEPGEWPWQVGLWHTPSAGAGRETAPFCGGTLISSDVVVTAAHCFPKTKRPQDHYVRVGDLNMATKGEQEEVVAVKQIILHTGFVLATYKDDIALIVLNKKLTLRKKVNTACLPTSDTKLSYCVVTGWGRLAELGIQPDILQQVQLPIVATDTCNKAYQKIFSTTRTLVTDKMICAGFEKGAKDACQGDSGGPLVCLKDDKYELRGIVSWGVGCARAKSYGVYTNTFKYLKWIRDNVNL